jgi:hypothetical protein
MRFISIVGNSFGCSASGERLVSAARAGDLQEAKALLEYNPLVLQDIRLLVFVIPLSITLQLRAIMRYSII